MKNLFDYIVRTTKTAFLRPFKMLQRKLKKSLFFKSKAGKIIKSSVKDFIDVMKRSPEKKSDYALIGSRYYAKRLLILSILMLLIFVAIFKSLIFPFVRGRFYTSTISLANPVLETYTGKVRLLNRKNEIVYEGKMENGKCTGNGTQYDDEGNLVYSGSFKDDSYDGDGELYARDGSLVYSGEFKGNTFEGVGKLYQSNQLILYEGNFANGYFSGSGKLYSQSGLLIYSGEFLQGLQNGYGVSYFDDGNIKYSGNFLNGKYHGEGTLLSEAGVRKYSGSFLNGEFDGYGKLFFENGYLAYDGQFALGNYHGNGNLFDEAGRRLYQGEFAHGYFQGNGKLFRENSDQIFYEGAFELSVAAGNGKYFKNNKELFSGEWKDGIPNFEIYLGLDSFEIRNSFLEAGDIIEYPDYYIISLPLIACDLYFGYPDDLSPPTLIKIGVKNEDFLDDEDIKFYE